MSASAAPNALTSSRRRVDQCVCHGRRQATSTAAAATTRSQATPAAGTDANRSTAKAEPRYCEIAPVTNSDCGGRRRMGGQATGPSMRAVPAQPRSLKLEPGVAAVVALALALGACGEDRGDGLRTTPAQVGTGATTFPVSVDATVAVSLTDYRLPRNVRVSRSGLVAFEATNDGQVAHALAVVGPAGQARTQTLKPGERT